LCKEKFLTKILENIYSFAHNFEARKMNFLLFIPYFLLMISLSELTMKQEKPEYLFKILSVENWEWSQNKKTVQLSAEDSPFIHLAEEEQLQHIILKLWKNNSTFVVLKIETAKLPGQLVHEVNPGGTRKYYHLYNGFIPTCAVNESKVIKNKDQETLKIIHIGNSVLREVTRRLSNEEILSKEIQTLIEQMKITMRSAPGVGLAAPQIGYPLQIIVIEDKPEYHQHLTQEKLHLIERREVPFHVLINPILYVESEESVEFFEACLSVENLIGIVPRARKVRVEALNEFAQSITISASGWYARILQHEIDHLNGILFIDRVKLRSLSTFENYDQFWKNSSIEDIKHVLKLAN
jgi:peptide deformylase